ncbi:MULTISPECIES: acyl-CoA dehydrogenase family protein [Rhodococcus]|uniref:acyl-CoA dehydrogenase family protein n=1 Tax=Rhodococcus TaxID=1827 RepID=UPI000EA85026|nr:acyl-CoA dehydrogenase family protein [Rhodococcus opacus]NHU47842.1 acyl-CoA dehydrogenase [Rhodococcus sp. A14]QZS52813.1 acyl-CoA dehydrogenase family protein [Rhodococcus opacus]RKM65190.1 acyl-CoA dehydrogenase [Rhodococcus opacus]
MYAALPDEYVELQQTVRRFAQTVVKPRAIEIDRQNDYPDDIFKALLTADLLGLATPEEFGGSGAGTLGLTIAIEEVAKYSNTVALMLLLTRLPALPILIGGSEEQKDTYVRDIASGARRASFGLSEPQAGSDLKGMRTRAVRDGADWVITGSKCWMSGLKQADFYTVFARTGKDGFSCFLIDRTLPGVSVARVDDKLGVRGVNTGELRLDGVRVPESALVGEPDQAFKLAMLSLNSMRPIVAARGLGLAEGALMYAVDYMRTREAFGAPLTSQQGLGWMVAEHAAEIEAARLLTYRAASMVDEGSFDKAAVPLLSMAKLMATETAVKVSGTAVQLLGAAGYTKDHPVEMYYRDAKQLTIVEGTSQIQKNLLAQAVFDRTLWWD